MSILSGIFEKMSKEQNLDIDQKIAENGVAPLNDINEQTRQEQEIVAFIKNKVDEARQNPSRVAFEAQCLTNIAYLLGYDSIFFDSKTRNFRATNGLVGFPTKARVHANLILPNIQNRAARLVKNPPKYDVAPNTNSEDDKDAARLTLQVINNIWETEHINEKRIELTMWMQEAGHAWGKVYWDVTKGKPLPKIEDEGENPADASYECEGDIGFSVPSPLSIFTDPEAKNQEEMSWLIDATVRKLSYFQDHYPERGHLVKEEGAWLLSIQNLLKINSMNSKGSWGVNPNVMKNCAIELAYYEKPTRKYPNGRMIVTANGVLLCYKELPVGKIPYVKFDDIKIGGKFFPESIITHLRPIQDQFNRNLRRKAEYINKGLTLKFIAAKGHGLTQESLNDNTEVLEYNHVKEAGAPQALPNAQMPQYVFNEDANLKNQFAEISGISEVSKGQLPSASIPAIGMQVLTESDDTRIGIVTESNENSWALIGELIARYAAKYYATPRFLKEAGEDGEWNFTEFTGEDLRESFDIKVIKGSTLPGSKVLKRQEIINLYERGYLGNPQDPVLKQKILSMLEYGELSESWEDLRTDIQQIKRSIKQLEMGQLPLIHPDDNHQLHFDYKNRLRKTEKFLSYDPQIQRNFLQDLEAHKSFVKLQTPPPPVPKGMEPPPPQPDIPQDIPISELQLPPQEEQKIMQAQQQAFQQQMQQQMMSQQPPMQPPMPIQGPDMGPLLDMDSNLQ